VTPEQAISQAQKGELLPVYLIVGEERHLSSQVIAAVRKAVMSGGVEGLNDDTMDAPQKSVEEVLAVARTLPMLATRRFVLCRNIEGWETDKKSGKAAGSKSRSPLDLLVDYADNAPAQSVVVLAAAKLDKRRKLYTAAKKAGFLISCEAPKRHELPGWIATRAREQGHSIANSVADLIAELSGPELSTVAEALERLSLYVGQGKAIDEEAVSECVVRLRTASVWELVSSVGRQDTANSLRILNDVYEPSDRGLRLLGVLGWATRQLIKFEAALRSGANPAEAAKAAGAPPFKARELSDQVRAVPEGALGRWLLHLAEADLALKGGSKRPPRAIMELMIMDLCRAS
jgi:DNA polymerase-3 subunit delta